MLVNTQQHCQMAVVQKLTENIIMRLSVDMFVVEMIDQTLNVPFRPGIRSLFQLSYNFCMLHGP